MRNEVSSKLAEAEGVLKKYRTENTELKQTLEHKMERLDQVETELKEKRSLLDKVSYKLETLQTDHE